MVKKSVVQIVKNFVKFLKQENIPVEAAILFGSYAKGNPRADSDIDIAIISKRFGKNRLKEGQTLLKKAWRVNSYLEPIPVSYSDFKNNFESPLLEEIRKHGIKVI